MATPEDLKRARVAMESDQHRRAREAKERAAREAKAALEQELATATKEKALAEEKEASLAKQEQQTEATKQAEFEKKIAQAQKAHDITEQLKTKKLDISPLRTFKSDMARAVTEEGVSIAKIAITQQVKNRLSGIEQDIDLEHRKNRPIPILVGILVVVLLGAGGWWWWQNRDTTSLPPPNPVPTIIATETTDDVEISGLDAVAVRQTIHNIFTSTETPDWTIKAINLTKDGATLDLPKLQSAIGLNIPDRLARNLGDNYLLGVYNNGEVKLPFLILTTRFYDQAFSGLLEWEASMTTDLLPVLRPEPVIPAELNPPFKDKLVRNKNARLLTSKAGHTLLFYVFLDKQTVAITRNEETFLELYDRFTNL